jgi:hypothetical protein
MYKKIKQGIVINQFIKNRQHIECSIYNNKMKGSGIINSFTQSNNPNNRELECAICHQTINIGDSVYTHDLNTGCKNIFHGNCIKRWSNDPKNVGNKCPVCRGYMDNLITVTTFR